MAGAEHGVFLHESLVRLRVVANAVFENRQSQLVHRFRRGASFLQEAESSGEAIFAEWHGCSGFWEASRLCRFRE